MLCYAIRHAESTMNANLGGGVNPDLTPLGQRQSEALAERLSGARLCAIYSSPYRRAVRTAAPLARRTGLPILLRHELCEFNPPGWRELQTFVPPTLEQVSAMCDAAARDPEDDGQVAWPPITEALQDVIARTRRFVHVVKQRWTGMDDAIVAFGHGLPVARLIDAWLTDSPGPAFRFIMDNAAVSALRYQDNISSLVCLNDVSHLVGLPPAAASNFSADYKFVKAAPPSGYW